MSRKLLLLALFMLCTTITASAAVSYKKAGPPPDCHKFPNQPRCN